MQISTIPNRKKFALFGITLIDEIVKLKRELNAVILSHYYQSGDIQDISDFVGDSLELSRKARSTNADVIVFCGVKFMAEVAKILNPNKVVIVPDMNAGCSLESSCKPEDFSLFRKKYPDHVSLTYINCSVEVKAMSDIIVTSSNAEKIINSIPPDQKIIFAPDRFLGKYLIKRTGRDMVLWHGSCIVHENFSEIALSKLMVLHPDAVVIAHPECPETLLKYAHFIGSTSALLNFVKTSKKGEFILLTESGIIHQMKKVAPNACFYTVPSVKIEGEICNNCALCPYMKLNTIEKVYHSMLNLAPQILLNKDVSTGALKSLNCMFALS